MNPWTFRQEFSPNGENRRIPIQVTATPQNINLPVEVFLTSLARDFRLAISAYIQAYASSRGGRINQTRLDNLKIFIFPTSRRNNGREMRRPSGAIKLKDLDTEIFEEVLEQVQSEEEGIFLFLIYRSDF